MYVQPQVDGLDLEEDLVAVFEALSNEGLASEIMTISLLVGGNLLLFVEVGHAFATFGCVWMAEAFGALLNADQVLPIFVLGYDVHDGGLAVAEASKALVCLFHALTDLSLEVL